jgi:hypothetical protein
MPLAAKNVIENSRQIKGLSCLLGRCEAEVLLELVSHPVAHAELLILPNFSGAPYLSFSSGVVT